MYGLAFPAFRVVESQSFWEEKRFQCVRVPKFQGEYGVYRLAGGFRGFRFGECMLEFFGLGELRGFPRP